MHKAQGTRHDAQGTRHRTKHNAQSTMHGYPVYNPAGGPSNVEFRHPSPCVVVRGSPFPAGLGRNCAGAAAQARARADASSLEGACRRDALGDAGRAAVDAIVLFDGKDLSKWVSQKDGTTPAAVGCRGRRDAGEAEDRRHPVEGRLRQRAVAHRVCDADRGEGRRPGPRQQRRVSDEHVRDSRCWTPIRTRPTSTARPAPSTCSASRWSNAIRKPGEWKSYEIIFNAPKFDEDGKVVKRATFTAFHNGVLVQDHVEVMGVTAHDRPPDYEKHADKTAASDCRTTEI